MANEHSHPDHDHHDRVPSPGMEEALDPASQSLSDALRASFRVLKWLMILVVVVFLASGVFIVDRDKEAVVQLRFGKKIAVYHEGVHWALPYPIDEVIGVATVPQTITVNAFWLDNPDNRPPSELPVRSPGLKPGDDGALLTGDQGMMHVLLQAKYRINNAESYVRNVRKWLEEKDNKTEFKDERVLLQAVLKNATVAAAARMDADVIWKNKEALRTAILPRAQSRLDDLETGILLTELTVDESYPPLQVRSAVTRVTQAENEANAAIQKARAERQEKLNGAAGPAWERLSEEIDKLDQVADEAQRDATLARIGEMLEAKPKDLGGEARRLIEEAELEREQIFLAAQARAETFDTLLNEYKDNPELFRQRMLKRMLRDLYAQKGVTKWVFPEGGKMLNLWLNRDQKEIKEVQEEIARKKLKN